MSDPTISSDQKLPLTAPSSSAAVPSSLPNLDNPILELSTRVPAIPETERVQLAALKKEALYRAAMNGDWESMIEHYKSNAPDLLDPVTFFGDTALHIAVCSKKEQPLKTLLDILYDATTTIATTITATATITTIATSIRQNDLLKCGNYHGNTALHHATIYGNFEAVKLLVDRYPDLVSITNKSGETPLFTAAEFADADIVRLLLDSLSGHTVDHRLRCLPSIHRQRSVDQLSILSAAILGQHFETALMLLKVDKSLHILEDKKGITALQLLAHIPSAFKSGYPMEIQERLIYCCLPITRRHKVKKLQEETFGGHARRGLTDMESGLGRNRRGALLNYLNVHIKAAASKMTSTLSSCKFFAPEYWPAMLQRIWNEKRKHVFALKLAKILIKQDTSWILFGGGCPGAEYTSLDTSQFVNSNEKEQHPQASMEDSSPSDVTSQMELERDQHPQASMEESSPYNIIGPLDFESEQYHQARKEENPLPKASKNESEQGDQEIIFKFKGIEVVQCRRAQTSATKPLLIRKKEQPLFTATRNGIEEIVRRIMEHHPLAVGHLNEMGQSILDVAVIHRKKEIFSFVKQKKIVFARLRLVTDTKGNTLLHHVADMEHYRGGTKPGPALQLQEELQWFERVRKVIPSVYVTFRNKKGKTAKELFDDNHQEQLKNAQKWIKETTQSCSTVAALVATVVFAAAYTVPGGSDEEGTPNFINSPYFLVFTVSDVISLASSLTSLVVFLSLLTSPFELEDFHVSLPRKLIIGFTFLFFSVITTMLSFGATILILIQSEKKLTTLLLSIAAFLPVLIFAIMQFRLYVSFMGSTFNFLKIITKVLPSCLVRRLQWGKKLR